MDFFLEQIFLCFAFYKAEFSKVKYYLLYAYFLFIRLVYLHNQLPRLNQKPKICLLVHRWMMMKPGGTLGGETEFSFPRRKNQFIEMLVTI